MWDLSGISLLYYILLVAPLRPIFAQEMFGKPIYHMGPYEFLACNDTQGQELMRVVAMTGQVLEDQVIPRANSSTSSKIFHDPFHIFFSSNTRSDVADVYQAMIDAPTTPMRPNFLCVNPDGAPELAHARQVCTSSPNGMAFSANDAAGRLEGTTFLCPDFWKRPAFPTAANCPVPRGLLFRGYFLSTGHAVNNLFSTIVHELAHYYSPQPLGPLREVYELNEIIYAKADIQLNNPTNFAYFAACKLIVPSMSMLVYIKIEQQASIWAVIVTLL